MLEHAPGHELYAKRQRIFVKHIWGSLQAKRWMVFAVLLGGFFLLPWLRIGDRPAVLLDVPARKFHIFWMTFWPQDTYLLALFLISLALTLFMVTAVWGRLWCGFACPQTVGTSIFLEIERWIEGDRNQQMKLDKSPWTTEKVRKRVLKHALFILISFAFTYNLRAYFISMPELLHKTATFTFDGGDYFWLLFFFVLAYSDFGRFREQLCHGPCPYGRFQGVMLDPNSLVVTFNVERGEPRQFFRKGQERDAGDCVDCKLCVDVCPAGIDIRKGPQFECISCMRCVDACNTVMPKVGFAPNLISIVSENQIAHKPQKLHPRLFVYAGVLVAMLSLISYRVMSHPITQVDVLRNRSFVYSKLPDGRIANVYTVKAINMDNHDHTYRVEVEGLKADFVGAAPLIEAKSGEVTQASVALAVRPEAGDAEHVSRFEFALVDVKTGHKLAEAHSTFVMPEREHDEEHGEHRGEIRDEHRDHH
ncbi:MAG TPA: cytochrome c oxidase accessory protein CcoG [Stenomitos sp.]